MSSVSAIKNFGYFQDVTEETQKNIPQPSENKVSNIANDVLLSENTQPTQKVLVKEPGEYFIFLDRVKECLLADQVSAAVKFAFDAINVAERDNSSWMSSPYTEVVDLLKEMVKNSIYQGKFNESLFDDIFTVVNTISDSYQFESFMEILESAGETLENINFQHPVFCKLIGFRNALADKCLERIHAPVFLEGDRCSAVYNLAYTLFSINYIFEAIEVSKFAIELANSLPDYNSAKMTTDVKGTEIERISRMLEEASEKLARKGEHEAIEVARLIPIENMRSRALATVNTIYERLGNNHVYYGPIY